MLPNLHTAKMSIRRPTSSTSSFVLPCPGAAPALVMRNWSTAHEYLVDKFMSTSMLNPEQH